jgi:glyoxylase-like metal-dependent hydrolase (beta-lactamase superfamily II)
MKVFRIENTIFNSNTYILSEENEDYCWLVDVGDIEPILELVGKRQIKGVFLTHTHYDHIYGINNLVENFPDCVIYTSQQGKEGLLSDKLNLSRYHDDSIIFQGKHIEVLNEGDEVKLFSNLGLKAIYTPGHDWSCMSYYTDDCIFTGDSYIPNIKVVTSFPKSNKRDALISLNRLVELCKTRDIYSGHHVIHNLDEH